MLRAQRGAGRYSEPPGRSGSGEPALALPRLTLLNLVEDWTRQHEVARGARRSAFPLHLQHPQMWQDNESSCRKLMPNLAVRGVFMQLGPAICAGPQEFPLL